MQKYSIRHDKNEKINGILADGKIALGITVGALGVILIYYVLGHLQISSEQRSYLDFFPVVISLLVALVSTYLAASALLEQRKAREAATDPILIAHLGQREDARELTTFNISNIGAGAALNVCLEVEEPDGGIEGRNLIQNIFRKHHPFAVIQQNKSIQYSLAMGWDLVGDAPLSPFSAKLTYEDLAGGQYESLFIIDVLELMGLDANKSPQMRVVSALEKMAGKLS